MTNESDYVSTTIVSMAMKLGGHRWAYLDGFLVIKAHDSLIAWSSEIKLKPLYFQYDSAFWPPTLVER